MFPPYSGTKRFSNKERAGSVLIIALIGISVVSLAVAHFASAYAEERQIQAKLNFVNLVSQTQLNIRNTVNSHPAWLVTIGDTANNPSMSCLQNQSCAPASDVPFILWPTGVPNYSNKALAIYDGTNPAAGFTIDGIPCTSFSLAGSPHCPIHVNLTWSTCGPAPCAPAVSVQVNILYRPGPASAMGQINEANYALSFVQVITGDATCDGSPPPAEVALCASPPYPNDKIYCIPSGWKCGQIFY